MNSGPPRTELYMLLSLTDLVIATLASNPKSSRHQGLRLEKAKEFYAVFLLRSFRHSLSVRDVLEFEGRCARLQNLIWSLQARLSAPALTGTHHTGLQ